jgi:hypothetical protein
MSVNLPKATEVGDIAFHGCPLTSIDLHSATHIGMMAFWECTGLKTVNLPSATSINAATFGSIDTECKLTLVNIPLVTTIGEDAFMNCNLETVICFDTARIDHTNMSEENRKRSVELSKTCKLIYDLTDKAVEWLKLRTRIQVAFGRKVASDTPNPVEPATELQFANFTFETFDQLRKNVKKLPKPVKQIWKQYVNDKIKMYHVDITFLNQFKPGKGEGVNAFLNEPGELGEPGEGEGVNAFLNEPRGLRF